MPQNGDYRHHCKEDCQAQVSLILRYVHFGDSNDLREDFITFIYAFGNLCEAVNQPTEIQNDIFDFDRSLYPARTEISLTGETLVGIILRKLKSLGLSLDGCVGIGTDGRSVMISEKGALKKEIQKEASNAVMTPCYSHKLNNVISQSSKVKNIENTVDVMKEVIPFFFFPKRSPVLRQFLGHKLAQLCNTSWVNDMMGFSNLPLTYPKLLKLCRKYLSGKIGYSCKGKSYDCCCAGETVHSTFRFLFSQIEEMARKVDIELRKPRICGRQEHRPNYGVSSVEDYYRVFVYIPLLDHIVGDLKERLSYEVLEVFKLAVLLPEIIVNMEFSQISCAVECVISHLTHLLGGSRDLQLLMIKGGGGGHIGNRNDVDLISQRSEGSFCQAQTTVGSAIGRDHILSQAEVTPHEIAELRGCNCNIGTRTF
ncbi:hypothetical protein PR048_029051 [Dryococelus australis]|uniref:DUF4371 domain-containing protein n=1 Tax=Dryococelus australis TaxID=614101 RepID=A0ABQ9GCA3_9NEOP|nr:hypothetical protein PR048_029051 [Dryococelus australis]